MKSEHGAVVTRIVRRVSERADSDPCDRPPLAQAVDPDGLARFVGATFDPTDDTRSPSGDGSVTFASVDHVVTVGGDGTVRVEEAVAGTAGASAVGDD